MKRIKSFLFLSFIVLMMAFSTTSVFASEWSDLVCKNVTDYDYDDGLANSKGNAIAETEDGYIWIGQYAGLTKYNGKKFVTISKSGDVDLNGVISLYAVGNSLYIGTQKNLVYYNEGTFSVIDTGLGIVTVNKMTYYDNTLYVATNKGLVKYKDGTAETAAEGNITDLAIGSSGIYYIKDKNVWSLNTSSEFYGAQDVKSIYIYNGKIYLGCENGSLIIVTKTSGVTTPITVAEDAINHMVYCDDLLFIGADDGAYTYDGNKAEKFRNLSITSSVEDIHMDYQGNLWIVSSDNGISKITSNAFDDLFVKYDISDYLYKHCGVTTTSVNAITRYNGLFYIATAKCLLIVNEETGDIVENDLSTLLVSTRIRDLAEFNGKLYIATYNADYGIVVYDGSTISYIHGDALMEAGKEGSGSGDIRCFESNENYLFVGTNYGISRIDKAGNILTIKPSFRPLYLYFDNDVLYACLESFGIEKYNDSLLDQGIVSGTEGETPLKCLTVGNGLLYSNGGSLYYYENGTTKKLPLEIVGSIVDLVHINNKYYIGTDSDIYVIDEDKLLSDSFVYTTLGRSEGLKSGLNSNASGFYDKDSSVYYFAASESVYGYDLNYNLSEGKTAKISVSSIDADGVTYLPNGTITLPSSVSRLTIYFDVLNYTDYNSFQVYYKLEGVDDDYISLDNDTVSSISYTNLSGGTYQLSIYAIDSKGIQTSNTVSLTIKKEKSFFENSWVIAICVLLGIVLLYILVYLIIKLKMRSSLQRQNEYKKITLESIEAVARTIDAKDKYTNGHSMRVGKYSRIIARALGLSDDECLNIYYIGLLHDIGKIAIPRAILNKPGRLTDEEFEMMKTHTVEGDKILSSISTIPHITEGARSHHEKYDGSGYPDHLKGENIPYIARIICCADCFDAMATRRSYKEPYPLEKVISEFERCKGTQFDPHMAEVVIELIKKGELKPEDEDVKSE